MDYTQSDQFSTHAGTGQRMHQEAGPVPTAVSQKDMNSVMWSLMEIVKAGGRSGVQFDPDTPASYQQLLIALQSMISTASGDIPGRVSIFMQPSAPVGWLPMSGLLLSRVVYPSLWAHVATIGAVSEGDWIGGKWGWFSSGDGSTTFRIPDLRAMSIRGLDDGRGTDLARAIGSYQASQLLAHIHATTEAAHLHVVNDPGHLHVVNDPGHSHAVNDPGHLHAYDATRGSGAGDINGGEHENYYASAGNTASGTTGINLSGSTTGVTMNGVVSGVSVYASSTGLTVNSAGGAEARVPNIALPFYIKY